MNTNDNEQECQTQKQNILAYLNHGKEITAYEALNLFGCMRLASRILELKRKGYPIISERARQSNGKVVAKYFLPKWVVWRKFLLAKAVCTARDMECDDYCSCATLAKGIREDYPYDVIVDNDGQLIRL